MSKIEFWNRNKEGNIIPQQVNIVIDDEDLKRTILHYETLLLGTKDNVKKEIYTKCIAEFKAMSEEYRDEKQILMIPLLDYEITNIQSKKMNGKRIGCDGLPVDDIDAHICATHCIEPSYSYEKWRDMKDSTFKLLVANAIIKHSFPELSDAEKNKKKKIADMIQTQLQSIETQSSTN